MTQTFFIDSFFSQTFKVIIITTPVLPSDAHIVQFKKAEFILTQKEPKLVELIPCAGKSVFAF